MELAQIEDFITSSRDGLRIETSSGSTILIDNKSGDIRKTSANALTETLFDGPSVKTLKADPYQGGCKVCVVLQSGEQHAIALSAYLKEAESWIKKAQKFYFSKNRRIGQLSDYPSIVVNDIVASKKIFYLPGRYIPNLPKQVPDWQRYYLNKCREKAIAKIRSHQLSIARRAASIELVEGKPHRPTSYEWMIDSIRYKVGAVAKIMIPLEVVFETETRSEKIGLSHFGAVYNFQVAFSGSNPLARKLKRLGVSKGTIELRKFCSVANSLGEKLEVATLTGTATDELIRGLFNNNNLHLSEKQFVPSLNEALIAQAVHRNVLAVADVGVVNDIADLYSKLFQERLSVLDVRYPTPLRIGFAYRNDDEDWAEICEEAWMETKLAILKRSDLKQEYEEFREAAKVVKLVVYSLDSHAIQS